MRQQEKNEGNKKKRKKKRKKKKEHLLSSVAERSRKRGKHCFFSEERKAKRLFGKAFAVLSFCVS